MELPGDGGGAHERGPDPGMEPDPKRQRVGESAGGGAQEDVSWRILKQQCKSIEDVLSKVSMAAEEERTRSRAQIEVLRLEIILLRGQLPANQAQQPQEPADELPAASEAPVFGVAAPPVPGQESDDANVGNGGNASGESSGASTATSEEDSIMAERSVEKELPRAQGAAHSPDARVKERSSGAVAPQPARAREEEHAEDDDASFPTRNSSFTRRGSEFS